MVNLVRFYGKILLGLQKIYNMTKNKCQNECLNTDKLVIK